MLANVSSIMSALRGCSQWRICTASHPAWWLIARSSFVFCSDVTLMRVKIFMLVFLLASSDMIVISFGCCSSQDRLPEKNSACCIVFGRIVVMFIFLLSGVSVVVMYASRLLFGTNW